MGTQSLVTSHHLVYIVFLSVVYAFLHYWFHFFFSVCDLPGHLCALILVSVSSALDFAGGLVVHVVGGVGCLVGILCLGGRLGRFDNDGPKPQVSVTP
jgi:ammonia channel protein AmtB